MSLHARQDMLIEIDEGSGFCFGVTTAIRKAEEELAKSESLYCLGDIVHNGREVERLKKMGLMTVGHADLNTLRNTKMLLRAHGEPPLTYQKAKEQNISLIDATCPVVLNLQKRIRKAYEEGGQIVIYGKNGHAEVVGLVGQTDGTAIVIENLEDAKRLDFSHDIQLFSQTTKSLEGFREIVGYIEQNMKDEAQFHYFDTICRRVANRIPNIRNFAEKHDVILFVCGKKSSNGKVLYNEMDTELSEAARHNFGVLGADNITVRNGELTAESLEEILGGFSPDVIYLDPARRSGSGGKVFLISDCKPDVTGLLRLLLKKAGKVMIKYSPMLDIARAAKELGGSLREVHVVASGGECKELLFILESGHSGEFRIVVSELPSGQFSFTPREEAEAAPIFADRAGALEGQWLFEPGKALMKAGAFNLTSQRFGLRKMGRSTHIYAAEKPVEGLMGLGRWLRVKEVIPLTGRSLKETGKRFPRAEVSARNIPMSSDQLRRRIGCGSGDEARIYGLRIDTTDGKSNNYLIIS